MQDAIATATAARSTKPACRTQKTTVRSIARVSITVVDMKTYKVEARWSIAPGTSPSGLAIDTKNSRLFAGCDNKVMMVIDAKNGQVVDKQPIGDGCDGVVFDSRNRVAFSSNGEGTVSAIKENNANSYKSLGNFPTKRGARTITIDEKTGQLFLPTAEFQKSSGAGRPPMIPGTFQVSK